MFTAPKAAAVIVISIHALARRATPNYIATAEWIGFQSTLSHGERLWALCALIKQGISGSKVRTSFLE